jgi:Methyltransferase FkbM domain
MEQGATTQAGGTRKINCVVAVTLDCLFENLPTPQVLKIDVEGMEDRVLAGGVRLLAEARPKIWCEVSSRNAERVSKTLRGTNYSMYDGGLDPVARKQLSQAVWDTVALPDK